MTKQELIVQDGVILDMLPDAHYRVQLEQGDVISAYPSGKIKQRYIKILIGDKVKVEISPYDPQTGRIVYRYKK